MPEQRAQSPPRGPRRGSTSPRRDRPSRDDRDDRRDRDRDERRPYGSRDHNGGGRDSSYRDRDYDSSRAPRGYDGPSRDRSDVDRPRSRSPPPRHQPRRPKELSFYKKGGPSMGSLSAQRDPLEVETEKERLQRREKGEVPARFGGTREQGVRNTMTMNPNLSSGGMGTSVGSLGRKTDPLDRLPGGGNGNGGDRGGGDKAREERMASMGKPQAVAPGAAGGRPVLRFIEVIANSRMGGKVRVKCLPTDTVGDLKRLIAAQTGTVASKIQLKKWYTPFKDHITLQDYEIHDGMSLEMY